MNIKWMIAQDVHNVDFQPEPNYGRKCFQDFHPGRQWSRHRVRTKKFAVSQTTLGNAALNGAKLEAGTDLRQVRRQFNTMTKPEVHIHD